MKGKPQIWLLWIFDLLADLLLFFKQASQVANPEYKCMNGSKVLEWQGMTSAKSSLNGPYGSLYESVMCDWVSLGLLVIGSALLHAMRFCNTSSCLNDHTGNTNPQCLSYKHGIFLCLSLSVCACACVYVCVCAAPTIRSSRCLAAGEDDYHPAW